jgi:hypothetical protein
MAISPFGRAAISTQSPLFWRLYEDLCQADSGASAVEGELAA